MSEPIRSSRAGTDPHNPLVFDIRGLPRRPGEMRHIQASVPAPTDVALPLAGVPEGAEVELDVRLESVVEGIYVSGTARTTVTGECARCLDPVAFEIDAELQELFYYPEDDVGEDDSVLADDLLDLEPVLRDAVVLELPLSPVCRDDCPGLCARCGVRLADAGPDHGHETDDPRWAALASLYDEMTQRRRS